MEQMSPFLQTALQAAAEAAEIARYYYCRNVKVEMKEDRSPVTVADVECERRIRAIISARFADHGFYGEETGQEKPDAEYLWLVDPIDGTKSFVRQYPFFSTQIALMRKGEIIVGVSSAPVFEELAYAERGQGARWQDTDCKVSDIRVLEDCTVSTGNLKSLTVGGRWESYRKLVSRTDRIRGYGDFYHYHLLASGRIDVVIESDVNILDIAAVSLIVEEAGGRFTDLEGKRIGLHSGSVLATNGHLHEQVAALFGIADSTEPT